ncbi:outer membrane beta-barrel protein [Chitinophaga sp. LS1]|uniref:outer membrane beta-barrel protein n=1 Tax=Chitinophaga sp. LS1 TaxID=3051176 RepID=UPI002AAAB9A8|nr:outer membrane beta-barrel protein [Chitinophaga sp. LS1]WPV65521.1 TonB-dependent receptor [Chitinophaga sp. LS1]
MKAKYRRFFQVGNSIIKLVCLSTALMVLQAYAAAQTVDTYVPTIQVTVLDAYNTPIADASLLLYRYKDTVLSATGTTDKNGRYEFAVTPRYAWLLKVSHLQYRDSLYLLDSATLSHPDGVTVQLQTGVAKQLNAVVVTGKAPLIERKIDRVIFNVDNSISLVGGSAWDAVQKAPGVRTSGENRIMLAGGNSAKVMLNGRTLQLSGEDLTNLLKSISSADIARIEVIANPPSMYDAAGGGGLINIVTKRNRVAGISGNIQGSYAQAVFPGYTLGGSVGYTYKKLSMMATLNASKQLTYQTRESFIYYPSQLWLSERGADYVTKSLTGTVAAEYNFNRNQTAGIRYTTSLQKRTTKDGTLTNIYSKDLDSLVQSANRYSNKPESHDLDLYFEQKLDSTGKKIAAGADYFYYHKSNVQELNSYNYLPGGIPTGDSLVARNQSPQTVKVYTAQVDAELPGKQLEIKMGAKVSFINNDSRIAFYNLYKGTPVFDAAKSDSFIYRERVQALYLSAGKHMGHWNLQAGLRGEFTQTTGISQTYQQRNENAYFRLFPTAYLMYQLKGEQQLFFSYGRRIGRPDYAALNPFKSYSSKYYYTAGNPFLQPSYLHVLHLGYQYKELLNSQLSAEIKHNGFDQLRIPDSVTNIIAMEQRNFLNVYSYGIEETLTFSAWRWYENYTYLQVYSNTTISTNAATQKRLSGWSMYISSEQTISWNQARTFQSVVSIWYQAPEINGIDHVGAYYSLDAGCKVSLWKKKVTIALNGKDLLKTNRERYGSVTNGIRQQYSTYYGSRSLRLTLAWKLGGKTRDLKQRNTNGDEKRRAN